MKKATKYLLLMQLFFFSTGINSSISGGENEKPFIHSKEQIQAYLKERPAYVKSQYSLTEAKKIIFDIISKDELTEIDANRIEGAVHFLLRSGHYKKAEETIKALLVRLKKIYGSDHPMVSDTVSFFGRYYYWINNFYLAELQYLAAQEFYSQNNIVSAEAIENVQYLTELYLHQKNIEQFTKYWQKARVLVQALEEKSVNIKKTFKAKQLLLSASMQYLSGKYQVSERRYLEAISGYNEVLGIKPSISADRFTPADDLIVGYSRLALCYAAQEKFYEAEKSLLRSVSMATNSLSRGDPILIEVQMNTAEYMEMTGSREEALTTYKLTYSDLKRALPNAAPLMGKVYSKIGLLNAFQGNYGIANEILNAVVPIYRVNYGRESYYYAECLKNLGLNYRLTGDYEVSAAHLEAAREILNRAYGNRLYSPLFFEIARERVLNYVAVGDLDKALTAYKRMFGPGGNHNTEHLRENHKKLYHDLLADYMETSRKAFGRKNSVDVLYPAFNECQVEKEISTRSIEMQRLMLGNYGSDSYRREYLKYRQLTESLKSTELSLQSALLRPSSQRNMTNEKRLQQQYLNQNDKVQKLKTYLFQGLPENKRQWLGKSVGIKQLQAVLNKDEAVLKYWFNDKEGFLWIVTEAQCTLIPLIIGKKELLNEVRKLRLGLDQKDVHYRSDLKNFELEAAYRMYLQIFAPAERYLTGIKALFIVPDGSLNRLPLSVLVKSAPPPRAKTHSDYGMIDWLIKHYAMQYYPSTMSIFNLKKKSADKTAENPFIGFGDPDFSHYNSNNRNNPFVRLPKTATELIATADVLGGSQENIFVQKRAGERRLRESKLSDYRVISFATHALLTEESQRYGISNEPCILLNLNGSADKAQDGFLSASEIAGLELNAELIILSGCNTGTNSEEHYNKSLSQLTRSFLVAGAQSVLVTHWKVDSTAATYLVVKMLQHHGTGRNARLAKSLQSSMIRFIDDKDSLGYQHPTFWAPFVLIGEPGLL